MITLLSILTLAIIIRYALRADKKKDAGKKLNGFERYMTSDGYIWNDPDTWK